MKTLFSITKLVLGIAIFSAVMYVVCDAMKNDEDNFDVDKAFEEMTIGPDPTQSK
jgi:hypothetical protein